MTPETYLMGYGLGDRQYLIRTEPPRFIADIHPEGSPRESGDIDAGELGVVSVCQWIDPSPGLDAQAWARLARETGEAIYALDAETDRRINEEEE